MSAPTFLQALALVAANGYAFALTRDTLTLQRDGVEAEGPFPLNLPAFDVRAGVLEVASLLVGLGDLTLAAEIDPAAPFYLSAGKAALNDDAVITHP